MTGTDLERLQELLDEMARVDMQIAPPSGIGERVLKRLDATPSFSSGPGRRTRLPVAWAAGGAGALAAILFLIVFLNSRPQVPPGVPGPVALPDVRARTTGSVPPTSAAASTVPPQPAAVVNSPVEPHPPGVERATELAGFVPLSPDVRQDLLGTFQVARVLLPREVLADLGVVLDANRFGGPIQADVVFGEDGFARAIRVASQDGRRSR